MLHRIPILKHTAINIARAKSICIRELKTGNLNSILSKILGKLFILKNIFKEISAFAAIILTLIDMVLQERFVTQNVRRQ
jgi:hypothetical protein